tara:strand:- start:780 stop:2186 length:1407 start_codon:yes stop_codon:yes gene_type:complete
MAYLKTTDSNVGIKAGTVPTGVDVTFPGVPQRRLYNFGERVAELAPEESPFFTYLSKVAKSPTDDSVFKVLENRSKIDWTNRTGVCSELQTADAASGANFSSNNAEVGDVVYMNVTSSKGVTLLPGMVVMVDRIDGNGLPIPLLLKIDIAGSTATWKCSVIENSGDNDTGNQSDSAFQVIGTAFEEGGNAPGFWSGGIDDRFGYTQIFKTACYMTGTAMATKYKAYSSEWDRVWNLKLREHKVDIERAMLFGQKARYTDSQSNAIQTSDGIIGFILRNVGTEAQALQSDDAGAGGDWAYEADKPYVRQITYAAMTYDRFLGDLEVMFDPARGGGYGKLCMAGLPTITWFNKLGSSGFLDNSAPSNSLSIDVEPRSGAFGHKITQVDTVHGQLNIVKDPLLRAQSAGYMPCVDIDHVAYRPLVGNGHNRDTHIMTNVQAPDEDSRKDQIITEAGLEVTLPETHALYCFS